MWCRPRRGWSTCWRRAGDTWNCADDTPEPVSALLADTATAAPETKALLAGVVMVPVGAVLSTRTLAIVGDVNVFPTLSVVITRRS